MKKLVYLVVGLSILAAYLQYQVVVYRDLVPVLVWSNETLYLNVIANRGGWYTCKWFNVCGEASLSPAEAIWHGEVAFRG